MKSGNFNAAGCFDLLKTVSLFCIFRRDVFCFLCRRGVSVFCLHILIAPWVGKHSIELVDFGLTKVKYCLSSLLGFTDFGLFNVKYFLPSLLGFVDYSTWSASYTCSTGIPFLRRTAAVSFSSLPAQVCHKYDRIYAVAAHRTAARKLSRSQLLEKRNLTS